MVNITLYDASGAEEAFPERWVPSVVVYSSESKLQNSVCLYIFAKIFVTQTKMQFYCKKIQFTGLK